MVSRSGFLRLDGGGRVDSHTTLERSQEDLRNQDLSQDEHSDEHGLFLAFKVPKISTIVVTYSTSPEC